MTDTATAATVSFTEQQIRWAKSHDWFVGVSPSGKLVCTDEYTKDGVFYRDTVSFDPAVKSFGDLRRWAGY